MANSITIEVGRIGILAYTSIDAGGLAKVQGVDVSAVSSNPAVFTVRERGFPNQLELAGISVGLATLTLSALNEKSSVLSLPIPVTVVAPQGNPTTAISFTFQQV